MPDFTPEQQERFRGMWSEASLILASHHQLRGLGPSAAMMSRR
jgi:hypothetical protein